MSKYESNIWENAPRRPGGLEFTKELIFRSELTGGTILDIGCGNGESSDYLQNHGFDVYGLDHSRSSVNKAVSKNMNVNFFCADAAEISKFEASYFDAILLECTASLIENAYEDYKRVLKPKGFLLISDLFDRSKQEYLKPEKFGFVLRHFSDVSKSLKSYYAELIWQGVSVDYILPSSFKKITGKQIGYYLAVFQKEV